MICIHLFHVEKHQLESKITQSSSLLWAGGEKIHQLPLHPLKIKYHWQFGLKPSQLVSALVSTRALCICVYTYIPT